MPEAVSLRQRLEFLGLVSAARIAGAMPRALFRPLANIAGAFAFALDKRGRAVALDNLRCAFGPAMNPGKRRRIARASYATFAHTMMELFWGRNLTRERARKIVDIEGLEFEPGTMQEGFAAIYPTLHFSNFEWLSLLSAHLVYGAPIVAQKFRNPLLGPVFDKARGVAGHWIIPQERAMIRMLTHLRKGGKFGMLCDLTLDPREGSVAVRQFGRLATSVTQMHAALAVRTGARLIPLEIRPQPAGRYRMIFHKPVPCDSETPVQTAVQQTWDTLERAIHVHPECWLWAYKHWRYRPAAADPGMYPFYAHVAPRFDRLVDRDLSGR